jgi:hypothetical protein
VGAYVDYRSQIEKSFSRVRFYASSQNWVLWTKEGEKFEFAGLTKDGSSGKYLYWGLTKVSDPNGNFMDVSYEALKSTSSSSALGGGVFGAPGLGVGGGSRRESTVGCSPLSFSTM